MLAIIGGNNEYGSVTVYIPTCEPVYTFRNLYFWKLEPDQLASREVI